MLSVSIITLQRGSGSGGGGGAAACGMECGVAAAAGGAGSFPAHPALSPTERSPAKTGLHVNFSDKGEVSPELLFFGVSSNYMLLDNTI